MTIKDILSYLKENKACTLSMLATHFHTQESAVEPLVEMLIQKGKIRKKVGAGGCAGGCGCSCGGNKNLTVYEPV